MEIIIALIAFAAGYLLRSWMHARKTGQPLADSLRNKRTASGPESDGAGGPGEEP